jgi:hypothetical protein
VRMHALMIWYATQQALPNKTVKHSGVCLTKGIASTACSRLHLYVRWVQRPVALAAHAAMQTVQGIRLAGQCTMPLPL